MKLNPGFTLKKTLKTPNHTHTKTHFRMVKDIKERPETKNVSGENTGESCHDIGLGNDFWNMTPKAQQ